MPSTTRRALVTGLSTALAAAAGCVGLGGAGTAPHWVSVYLGEREERHDVSVAVTNGSGETLFERTYRLSDDNEAHEDATFPGSTEPETVVVTVDGTRFEREELPCDDPNRSGVELWVEDGPDGTPEVRTEADCQHVTAEER
jgi:hypothetical protein